MQTVTGKLQFFNYFEALGIEKTRQSQENSNFSRFSIIGKRKIGDSHMKTAIFLGFGEPSWGQICDSHRKNQFFNRLHEEKLVFSCDCQFFFVFFKVTILRNSLFSCDCRAFFKILRSEILKNCCFPVTVAFSQFLSLQNN